MKKTVAAALTAAFVMGVSSSTFAAANPFSDVPAGHWAYNSISKLAAAGVVEGYGDGTYRGDRNITRYEMAQMIAKAMAKNPTGANKAELDRLAAEFRDELDALGVRVAELEKYADKVVWHGELRYRYVRDRDNLKGGGHDKETLNRVEMRFMPTATVNDHWKLKARMDARVNMDKDAGGWGDGSSDFRLRYGYAEGTYGRLQINVGRLPFYTNVDDGLVMDDFFSGAQIVYGDKFKVALMAGRWGGTNSIDPSDYQGGELSYDNGKFYIGAGYHHFSSDYFKALHSLTDDESGKPVYKDSKSANVWAIGTHYNFDMGLQVRGAYASNTKAKENKRSWTAGLAYKGADKTKPGSWGISADYRYVSDYVSLAPTFDTYTLSSHKKGVDIGVDWAPIENTYVALNYFWGKRLDTREKTKTFFARASWFF